MTGEQIIDVIGDGRDLTPDDRSIVEFTVRRAIEEGANIDALVRIHEERIPPLVSKRESLLAQLRGVNRAIAMRDEALRQFRLVPPKEKT